jgi:hypothetical protein
MVVYTAQNPTVAGLGMVAVRDAVSSSSTATRAQVKWAIACGTSQSGRFLRTYLYDGFNQDEPEGVRRRHGHVAGRGAAV